MNEINFIKQTQSDSSTYRWLLATCCLLAAILIVATGFVLPRLQLLRTYGLSQVPTEDPLISEYQSALREKDALEARQEKRNRKTATTMRHITLFSYLAHMPITSFERITINKDHYELEGKMSSMKNLDAFIHNLKEKTRSHVMISSLQYEKDYLVFTLKIESSSQGND